LAKKLKLEIDYFEDYHLLSIASQMKDYLLAFHINRALNIDLKKYRDLRVEGRKGLYPWFFYSAGKNNPSYYLVGNNHVEGKISPHQKGIDYFLIIKEMYDSPTLGHQALILRRTPGILGVFHTNMPAVKDMDLLIESIELHEMEEVSKPARKAPGGAIQTVS
jgi:hypothetical protein